MKKNEMPIFDSIAQCSAVTHIPVSELRRAKRGGCKGFRSHRVDAYEVLKWLFGEGKKASIHITDVAFAKEQDLLASAKLKTQKWAEKEGALVPEFFVSRAIRETMLPAKQRLHAMPSECAHLCNPADPIHARKALESWLENNLPIMKAGTLPDQCPFCGQKNVKQQSKD